MKSPCYIAALDKVQLVLNTTLARLIGRCFVAWGFHPHAVFQPLGGDEAFDFFSEHG